jgi:hypothetical protein
MKAGFVLAAAAAVLAVPVPLAAAGNSQSGPTVGDCISDGFYGNEPNMANGAPGGPAEQAPGTKDGNVVPSQSPGPKVTNPDGSVRPGASVGDIHKLGFSVPAICRSLTSAGSAPLGQQQIGSNGPK